MSPCRFWFVRQTLIRLLISCWILGLPRKKTKAKKQLLKKVYKLKSLSESRVFFTKVGNDSVKLVKRGHKTAKPTEMRFFTGGFCACTNYSLQTQICLIALRRFEFHINFQESLFLWATQHWPPSLKQHLFFLSCGLLNVSYLGTSLVGLE